MRKLLIIYPHWYPSNLAGVHRPRLTGNFFTEFGWQPIILTVKPEYYEETTDTDMYRLFSPDFKEYRVDAIKARKPRIIGDIGLRAFRQLYNKAKEIIASEKPDFLWIPIPSFYTALLGRLLHAKTGILYGIDYIDPWVRDISKDGSLRARLSLWVAKLLEPIAVKKASLITGVAYEYYKPVLERNFFSGHKYKIVNRHTLPIAIGTATRNPQLPPHNIFHTAFPYGFDPHDHEIEIPGLKMPWDDRPGCIPIVYAGAFMPNSQYFLNVFFKALSQIIKDQTMAKHYHFYFLGTGFYPHKRITAYAADHGVEDYVTEIRNRFPFLHILNFLAKANKVLIIGSTEKHYTASKTFQVILSKRPFLGMFHCESTAVPILKETRTNTYLVDFIPDENEELFYEKTRNVLNKFLKGEEDWNPDFEALEPYSAKKSAQILAETMEAILESRNEVYKK